MAPLPELNGKYFFHYIKVSKKLVSKMCYFIQIFFEGLQNVLPVPQTQAPPQVQSWAQGQVWPQQPMMQGQPWAQGHQWYPWGGYPIMPQPMMFPPVQPAPVHQAQGVMAPKSSEVNLPIHYTTTLPLSLLIENFIFYLP